MASSFQSEVPGRSERLVLDPAYRREAVLDVIRGARRELVLSVFRCDDFKVLDELASAVQRKVRVRALLTPHAKNWDRRLQDLGVFLESMGAEVHRYAGSHSKYHAKYIVADAGPALVASLNFTRKCFQQTCDFILITHDPKIVSDLVRLFEQDCHSPDSPLPAGFSDSLIVGPDTARTGFLKMLGAARRTIRIIDHRVNDPAVVALLRDRQAAGVSVQVLGLGAISGQLSHGKMLLIDEDVAAIGSISLFPSALNERREVAVLVRESSNVDKLRSFFEMARREGLGGVSEWSVAERLDDQTLDDLE
jgi:phosphatidylserine/phosphatidylglycerophosphate/cardiolipin synthase-like enzyme